MMKLLRAVVCVVTMVTGVYGLVEKGECPTGVGLGDMKFDGCDWCVCTPFGWTCTDGGCGDTKKEDTCPNVGQKWTDGCYQCHCHKHGISCVADANCVHGLRRHFVSCEFGNLCLCGVDGVPVCAGHFSKLQAGHGISTALLKQDTVRTRTLLLGDACSVTDRWYLGGQRCYCDKKGKKICGDPRRVTKELNTVRMKNILCEKGVQWISKCDNCTCLVSGVVFCTRLRPCHRKGNNRVILSSHPHVVRQHCSRRGHTWLEGCRKCHCNLFGHLHCSDKDCGQPVSTQQKEAIPSTEQANRLHRSRNEIVLPPLLKPIRRRPRPHENASGDCGHHRPGEVYWDRCNLCRCTEGGHAMCQMKGCAHWFNYERTQ